MPQADGNLAKLSIEERSNVEERKLTILKDYAKYMEDHPELRQALNDFTCAVLTEKPQSVYKFARYWFYMSLPPLDPMSTAGTKARATPAPQEEQQTIEHVRRVGTHRLLSRIYSTIDSNADTRCTKKEFMSSPLFDVWDVKVWDRMDQNEDGSVTPTEFFRFMRSVEADEGKAKFHETVCSFINDADINIMDMLPAVEGAEELRKMVEAKGEEKLRAYLFKAAIHQGSGDHDRDFIYRKEMQYSKIGQQMLPFWDQLDTDQSGKISLSEWNAFWDKAKNSALGEHAPDCKNLLVDVFIEGSYDINEV